MNETRTAESEAEHEYDPERYVSDVWTEELTSAGLSQHRADQIRQLTFGDPELSLGDPSSEDVLRVAIEAVEQFDFESAIDEDSETDADELRDRLIEAAYAGLTGRLLGPAAAPSDVALDNEGISTVDTAEIEWTPPGEETEDQTATPSGPSGGLAPGEARRAMTASGGFNSELQTGESADVKQTLETLAYVAKHDSSTEVRVAALEAIGSITASHDEYRRDVVDSLEEWLESDEAAIRAAAAAALGQALGIPSTTTDDGEDDEDPSEPRNADPFS